MADSRRCARCGAVGSEADLSGLCASCLLELALAVPDAGAPADEDGEPLLPEAAYRVVTILGADEHGTTYLAERDRSRRLVTLHVVKLGQPLDEARQRAFREQASRLERLAHPGIQPILDARLTGAGDACVVSPYTNGPQIGRYCSSCRFDGPARARLFSLVCDAVGYAHRQGVSHGRLRPDAVVVQISGRDAAPLVVGFSIFPGIPPGVDADVAGVESIGRAMGWAGASPAAWTSLDALREAVCEDWRRMDHRR